MYLEEQFSPSPDNERAKTGFLVMVSIKHYGTTTYDNLTFISEDYQNTMAADTRDNILAFHDREAQQTTDEADNICHDV